MEIEGLRNDAPLNQQPVDPKARDTAGDGATQARPIPDDAMPIIPVRGLVLFPGVILAISLSRDISIAAAQAAARGERPVGVVLQRDLTKDNPGPDDLHWVGTVTNILRYITAPDGGHHIVAQGDQRFRITQFVDGFPFMVCRYERIEQTEVMDKEAEAQLLNLRERAVEALQLSSQAPAELIGAVQAVKSPGALADLVAHFMDLKLEEKQEVLEIFDVKARLDRVSTLLAHRLEVLRLSRDIDTLTKESMGARQREYLLREQLKTIQKELGEDEGHSEDIAELTRAIEAAKMPEESEQHARKALQRLERMPEAAAEYSMLRGYLEWLTELPWSVMSESEIDIGEARKILDEDHYGLVKIKRRILEYLAVRKLKASGRSPILCFVGPPGVGKTSLGQSIARATGRKFMRISLGGVHDEAEIRGHRRTYIGALPGSIIQAIRKAGTRNPVFMLDEMDKLGAGMQGDPSSALLEVLDPEQNSTFRDNYLAVPFDLSQVMFIGTANMLDTIPGPLRDRMEVIHLPGYTEEEKVQIARRKQLPISRSRLR